MFKNTIANLLVVCSIGSIEGLSFSFSVCSETFQYTYTVRLLIIVILCLNSTTKDSLKSMKMPSTPAQIVQASIDQRLTKCEVNIA